MTAKPCDFCRTILHNGLVRVCLSLPNKRKPKRIRRTFLCGLCLYRERDRWSKP